MIWHIENQHAGINKKMNKLILLTAFSVGNVIWKVLSLLRCSAKRDYPTYGIAQMR